MQLFRKLQIIDKIFLIYLLAYFIIYLPTFWFTSATADEGTHLLLATFYRDLIQNIFSTKNFSFQHAYDFGINYLVHYPKIQIAYPPLYHLIVGNLFFPLFGTTLFAGRLVGLLFALLSYSMLYVLVKKFFNPKMALISVLFFSLDPFSLLFAKRAMADYVAFFFMFASIYLYYQALKSKQKKYFFFAGVFASLAALSKQFAGIVIIFMFFHYLLSKNKNYKNLFVLVASFLILLVPYLYILSKIGGFQINYLVAYQYAVTTGEPTSFSNPSLWTYYLVRTTYRFYLLPLFLAVFIFYVYRKQKFWKEMLIWFLIFYIAISVIPNKEERFSQYFLISFYIAASFYFSKLNKKILVLFFLAYTILSLYPIKSTFVYYPTHEVSQFVYNNLPTGANVAVFSEGPYTYSSAYMFYLASLDRGKSIHVLRPCAFDNKNSQQILGILKESNVYFIIADPKADNTFITLIKGNAKRVQLGEISSIEVYSVKNFTYLERTEKCNYVCLTEEKICEK